LLHLAGAGLLFLCHAIHKLDCDFTYQFLIFTSPLSTHIGDKMDIASISAVVAATGVLIGVVLTILELRNLVKTRQMDLLMDLYLSWDTEDMKKATGRFLGLEIENYNDFVKKHGPVVSVEPERSQIWNDIDRIGWFFNGAGFLVQGKFVDIKSVDDLLGYGVVLAWEKMKPLVEGWREEYNMPKSFGWFEHLANEIKKREQTLQLA
jgi:hypothetical protein